MHAPLHLGLGPSPRPEFLYVSTEHSPSGWHRWDHARGEAVVVAENACTGYLRDVAAVERERRGETKVKLDLTLACGPRVYVVESGIETQFSRSVLAALARLTPRHLRRALCVEVRPGDEDKVVFGDVFDAASGVRINTLSQDREAAPEALLARVRDALATMRAEDDAAREAARHADPPEAAA
jgi:hypothetical protein